VLSIVPVVSVAAPELAPYRTLRRHEEHDRQGIFVAQGDKVVSRVLHRGLPLVSVLATPDRFRAVRPLLEQRTEPISVYLADDDTLAAITGHRLFQGILAVARTPREWTLAELLAAARRPRFLVALDGLSNAENLGAVARSALAFGVQGLLIGETCAPPWLRRAVRASLGTLLDLPVVRSTDLAADLAILRAAGLLCLATDVQGSTHWPAPALRGDVCLVFGSEGAGLRPALRAACDATAAVSIAAEVESLNVACAASIFFYEIARSRRSKRA
jgi:tRNA G18 (ribose-2'-O)-methylase SpoU